MGKTIVLIVEDEALIRMEAADVLEDAGYEPLEAADADEAIRLLETRPDIGAVFTDINMAGSMDGLKLAHAISRRWPPVHLIVTSGKGMPDGRTLPPHGRFIAKPYAPKQLAELLGSFFAPGGRDIGMPS